MFGCRFIFVGVSPWTQNHLPRCMPPSILMMTPPPSVEFPANIVLPEESRLSRCLVCKVLTSKPINHDAFRCTIMLAWKPQMTVEDRFICDFNSDEDNRRIIVDSP